MDLQLIFQSHFPGNPILPGICIIQLAVEHAEHEMGISLSLMGVKNVKFLSPITPNILKSIHCELSSVTKDGDTVTFRAIITDSVTVYAKMHLKCRSTKTLNVCG